MNKRLILISRDETADFSKYFGIGIDPTNVIILSRVNPKDEFPVPDSISEELLKNLETGDGVLLADKDSFGYLRQHYHFGIRSENFFDCSKLPRLSIEGGAFVKCIYEGIPTKEELDYFMSPDFCIHRDFSWFKQKVLHTVEDSIGMIDYFDSLPDDTNFGFDYEASGMPLDKQFEISGASICTTQFGGFISFTDCRHNNTPEQYQYLLKRLGEFLEKRQRKIWVYNMQYEFQVSHRMLNYVDLGNLCDAGVINVLDGYHLKKYSLKWTAQRVLGATVWDTEFDRISDLINEMLFDESHLLKVDQSNFKNTPQWAELCKRYPSYQAEFEILILEYWGNEFMCIPSDILGYYCNLDSFYTLMLYEAKRNTYSEQAFEVFMDNLRLACRLHSCGINKWEDYRQSYENYCIEQLTWGITYCATARCKIKMDTHSSKMANISKYHPVAQKLICDGKFFNADALEITKYILSTNIDTMDAYDTGVNEGQLVMTFGDDFAEAFMNIVRDAMTETKMKTKIDDGIVRKKKILGIISEKLKTLIGLDTIKINDKLVELEKYMYYEKAYNELRKISKNQLNDINNIPNKIHAFGQTFDLIDYSTYISNNYFKCKSPIENDLICFEFANLFRTETTWLASIFNSSQQLSNETKFYTSLGINNIEDGYTHFMNSWKEYCESERTILGDYPEKVYTLASEFYSDIAKTKKDSKTGEMLPDISEKIKDVWANFDGYKAQSMFFSYVDNQFIDYGKPFDEIDLSNNFFFMRKFVINYLLFKKYSKILTTYIGTFDKDKKKNVGMFLATDKWVIENPNNHVVIREADPNEPGAVRKMFAKFAALEKSSKRWSSGYHTIISHSDIKSTLRSYPGCLLSYFDISSAEVKSAGYQSGDENLIYMFLNGIDVYVATAKIYLGEDNWNNLDGKSKKKWRKNFKQIFLGILYGLGRKTLSENLNTTEEEAQRIIDVVYKSYPKLREYIAGQQKYPFEHDGCINTFFGDRLQVDEWKWYQKTDNPREKRSLEARISRLAVNLPIQGGTSAAMSSGFYNDLRVASQEGWNLTSFVTVHDSNTCNFPVEKLWELRSFYDENFTEFCYKLTGIKLLFDILIGATYQDACEAKQIDSNTIELTGNARSIHMILDELNYKNIKYECSIDPNEIIPEIVENPIQRFIKEEGCSFVMDESDYTIQLKKI